VAPQFPPSCVCAGQSSPFPPFLLAPIPPLADAQSQLAVRPSIYPTARSRTLGNAAWLLSHLILPIFLELTRGCDVCHTLPTLHRLSPSSSTHSTSHTSQQLFWTSPPSIVPLFLAPVAFALDAAQLTKIYFQLSDATLFHRIRCRAARRQRDHLRRSLFYFPLSPTSRFIGTSPVPSRTTRNTAVFTPIPYRIRFFRPLYGYGYGYPVTVLAP